MPLYFAYGSNMDVAGMAVRCPHAKPLGTARLARHRLAIMREGWLTATRDPRGEVQGVLWEAALSDMHALDRYEGLSEGFYAKSSQPVIGERGAKRAIVYFGANSGPGVARPDYIAGVLAAARRWKLATATIAQLEAFAAAAGVATTDGSVLAAAPRVRPRFATPFDRQ